MVPSEEMRTRLLKRFRVETTRNLGMLRSNLPFLGEPDNRDAIITMFFAAHTIKGSLGMMQLLDESWSDLNEPASFLESTIMSLRDDELTFDEALVAQIEQNLSQIEDRFLVTQELAD